MCAEKYEHLELEYKNMQPQTKTPPLRRELTVWVHGLTQCHWPFESLFICRFWMPLGSWVNVLINWITQSHYLFFMKYCLLHVAATVNHGKNIAHTYITHVMLELQFINHAFSLATACQTQQSLPNHCRWEKGSLIFLSQQANCKTDRKIASNIILNLC